MSNIIENYGDLGLDYDISFVDVKTLDVPSYDTIYVLASRSAPIDVAMMGIEAVDRSRKYDFLDCDVCAVAEDIRNWFCHPENDSYDLSDSFWRQVEDFMYTEKVTEENDAAEWQREVGAMAAARTREALREFMGDY